MGRNGYHHYILTFEIFLWLALEFVLLLAPKKMVYLPKGNVWITPECSL